MNFTRFLSHFIHWLNNLGDGWNHVILHSEHLVVQEGAMVLADGLTGILSSLVGHGGGPKELAELVTVKSANFQVSNFSEQFLKIVIGDLLLVDVSDLELDVGWSHSLGLGDDLLVLIVAVAKLQSLLALGSSQSFLWSSGEPASVSSSLSTKWSPAETSTWWASSNSSGWSSLVENPLI